MTQPGVPGELFVRSKTVFTTYYKAHDKYEEDRRGTFHTVGDMAYFDEEGFYYICDRKKDMIISGGMNIYPAEIEAALEHHPAIVDVAVFGIPNEEWGEAVHAIVVAQPGTAARERRGDRLRARAPRQLQDPALGLLPRRDPAHRLGQDPEARAARALLEGPHDPGLTLRGPDRRSISACLARRQASNSGPSQARCRPSR